MAKDFNNKQVVAGYDQHIRKLIPGYELIHLQVHALLKSYLKPEAEVVVVGCGTGYELQYLAEQFPQWRFTAIDPAINMLKQAEQHIQDLGLQDRITFVHGDSSVLQQMQGQFDAAVTILVSHFVAHDLKPQFFQDIADSLKPTGICLSYDLTAFQYPSQGRVFENLALATGLAEAQATAMMQRLYQDFYLIDPQQLKQLYLEAGFEVVDQFAQVLNYVGLIGFNPNKTA